MIKVKAEYINAQGKTKKDYFIFTDIEVTGHADKSGVNNNVRICAGISACCFGINRLIDDEQFTTEYESGHFHIYTTRTKNLRQCLDRDSVHALNTLVCQLYEIYCKYPRSFKSFDLVDVKEKFENDERTNKKPKQPRFRKRNKMGFLARI